MALTGDPISPEEALACGLVSRVVPPDMLLQTAKALAHRIVSNPPGAIRMTKRLLRGGEGEGASLHDVLESSAICQAHAHQTAEHREAVMAFLEKRPPVFES